MKNALLRSLCLLLVLLVASTAWARFTLEQVMSSPFPNELTAAKQGERIAWVFNAKGVRNVWVDDGPDFSNARQLTHYSEDGQQIASVRLTPDGKTVVYVRGTEVNGEDRSANPLSKVEQPKQQVWAIDVEGSGSPRLLGELGCDEEGCEDIRISPDGQFALWATRKQLWIAPLAGAIPGGTAHQLINLRGENDEPRWSPDGKQIAFVSHRHDHSLIAVYDFDRQSVRYLSPSFDRDGSPRWSPDGKQIAFIRRPGLEQERPLIPIPVVQWSIYVADASTGAAKKIWQSGEKPNDSFPDLTAGVSFHFAGDRIVFASEQDGWNHLYSIPAAGGKATLLTPGDFEVEDVTLSNDKKSILFSSNQNDVDRRHLWQVSVDGGTPEQLTKGETIEWSPLQTGDGKHIVLLGSSGTEPAMPYFLSGSGRKLIAANALPQDFPSAELVTPKPVVFQSEDGFNIHGQLFTPRNLNGRAPALLFIHGGPIRQMVLGFHYMNYYHNAYAENQYLASLGYVVLSVNYRLGIMYGRAFREPANSVWRGSSEYKDILAAGKYLQSLPNVDPQKIGLWGGSYGGLLTALGLARSSDIFKAGVDMHGVHDWSRFLPSWEEGASRAPDLAQARKLAFESSPNASIATWKSPVLLIQGDDDRNVPVNQTVDLVQRLREHHVPFETLMFPDDIHDFLLWRDWVRAYSATADFFDRTLKRGEQIGVD